MSLHKRGRFWHYDFEINKVRYRGSTKQTSKTKARQVEERERDRISLGGNIGRVTLKAAARRYWDEKGQHLSSAQNVSDALKVCARCIDFEIDIRDLDEGVIGEGMNLRRAETTVRGKPPSNATVNREFISTLRPIQKFAGTRMRVRGLPDIDWKDLKLAKHGKRVRELTTEEFEKIRNTLPRWHRELFDFFTKYGVRLTEAFFPLDNIDIEGRRIFLRQRKGDDWHTIPILPEDIPAIRARLSRARAAGIDTIWYRPDGEGIIALKPSTFQRASKRAIRKLKIKDLRSVHDYRHHAAMQALRRSRGNLPAVQSLLGHTDIKTTTIYAHAMEDDVRAALGENLQDRDDDKKNETRRIQ